MPKVDLKLYSTDAAEGKKITTSVTYVNPAASNAVLKSFAQQLNAFTTNAYLETDRVETVNVDTDTSRKQYRDILITGAAQGATATISANVVEGVTVNPAVFYYSNGAAQVLTTTSIPSADPTVARFTVSIPNSSGQIFAGIATNDYFYADFVAQTVS